VTFDGLPSGKNWLSGRGRPRCSRSVTPPYSRRKKSALLKFGDHEVNELMSPAVPSSNSGPDPPHRSGGSAGLARTAPTPRSPCPRRPTPRSAAGLQASTSGEVRTVEVAFGVELGGPFAPIFSGTWSTDLPVAATIRAAIPTGGVASVPEPSTFPLLAAALGFFGLRRRVLQRDRSPPRS
jgi:hypothetical protein